MSKTVLSVGQCRPDGAAISHYMKSNFGASVIAVDLPDQALSALETNAIDLVLINRKLDIDMSDGLEILKSIRSSPSKREVPVMLVSNFPEWQDKAIQMGATYGFGKAELNRPETRARLAAILEPGS